MPNYLANDGSWTWFNEPRAVYNSAQNCTYWGGASGGGLSTKAWNVGIVAYRYDHAAGTVAAFRLDGGETDGARARAAMTTTTRPCW